MKNRGLGRGLDALLSNDGDNVSSKIEPTNVMLLSQLTPGKFQPRKNFNQDLAGAEIDLVGIESREYMLKNAIGALKKTYDFVLIDCPPTLNLLTVNALVAATAVLIPMQCEYYALEGLSDLVGTIKRVKKQLNPTIEIEGLLRTLFDKRNTLAQQVSDELSSHFGSKVYKTIIPRNVRLAEAPSHGKAAMFYDRSSKGAKAYLALAAEILKGNI